jgi:hypothetical protein
MIARLLTYPPAMVMQRPSGFIEPCLPSKAVRPPTGPLCVHEIKHDGYRLMVRRDGLRVRCFTRNGHDWADRFPAIVEAAAHLKAQSFLIDGEAVIVRDDGTPDFRALRSRRHEAVLFAFDLIGPAQRMGIGQSAMSEMLAGLRGLLEAAPVAGIASENGRPTVARGPKRIAAALS